MPLLTRSHRARSMAAALATIALVLGAAVAVGAPASADTPPPGQGTLFADLGETQFPGQGQGWCSFGVPEYEGQYEEQGWVQIPAGVHHVLLSAIGDAGSSGSSGGASGGLGGAVSAIVPAYAGQIFYASPDSSVTEDSSVEANGGRASFISTVSPTTLFPTHDPEAMNPSNLCFTEFDPFSYPAVMPASDLVLVAGGGGGGGDFGTAGAGGNAGPNGANGSAAGGAGGGGGGTQSGGGGGGTGADFDGYNGTYLSGGDNFNPNVTIGGGGGAGYFGGGNGSGNGSTPSGGGGGGSNYVMSIPNDGVSKVLSNGTTTAASEVSIVPIYEPTVSVSAPVNPSVVNTPTTITVTVSGLPTAATVDEEGETVTVRPAASGTVSMVVNGVTVTQSFNPLVGADTGVRTATFTVTGHSSGTTNYVATYNGDTSQESAFYFGDLVNPESSASFAENYKPAVAVALSGSMTYGDSTATFTPSESLPSGVTISGTVTCSTADGGVLLADLSAGAHPIDPAECSGLTLAGPNADVYGIVYTGSITVARKPITAYITGGQPTGGTATFSYYVAPTEYSDAVTGAPTCTTLGNGTTIGPSLSRGVYTLGACTGLSLAVGDIDNYTLTVTPGQFVSGTSAPTLTIPTLAGATAGSGLDTRVTLAGGDVPSGVVSFSFYDNDSCTGTPLSVDSASVTGNGDYDTGTVVPEHAGTFSVSASYSGDTFNSAAAANCAVVTVAKADAGVTFTAPATGLVGQPLSASAILSSSVPRVGNSDLRVFLFPASDTTCRGDIALINTDDGTITSDGVYTSASYTPTAPGTYRWVIIFSGDANHLGENSICSLTTVVSSAPTITSGATATFDAGGSGSFTVTTAAGSPATTALSASGTLPDGVTFTDNGDGTATLAGTPGVTAGGQYPITITAANSATSTTQNFVLTVQQSAVITTTNATTFLAGTASSFTIRADSGYPTSTTLSAVGALPNGITFTDNGDGTATLAGAPGLTAGGSYPISIHATNSAVSTTQSFVLTVNQTPVITTASTTTFVTGSASSFTIRADAGYPGSVAFSSLGTLPDGITFTDNGDGTATLAGTPGAMTGGTYPIQIDAGNSATSVSQSFLLTVDQPPTIATGNGATFVTGTASSFTIGVDAGYPTATSLSVAGALPVGVTFVDNGDGTGTLSGIPDATTGGSYPLTVTAGDGVVPDASQDFTLTVDQPVAIDAADQAVFQVGQSATHTIATTAGYPVSTGLTLGGTLPAGLTFTDARDGTATISGTPGVGTGGLYPVTITASNGIGTPVVQDLEISVNEQPAFTSADATTDIIGVTSTFSATTIPGYPAAYTLSTSSSLPPGLSLDVAGGSATLSGVPTGPAASYPIVLTASNGISPVTTQTLTVTIADASAVPLPLLPPLGGGTITGVPTATHPGQSFVVTASGFAAGAPVTWGIYSSPQNLANTVADSNGTASTRITIPAGFAGLHTIVVTGIALDGSPLIASATTTVTTPVITPAQLPGTGASLGTSPDAAMLFVGIGVLLMLAARLRRRPRASRARSLVLRK